VAEPPRMSRLADQQVEMWRRVLSSKITLVDHKDATAPNHTDDMCSKKSNEGCKMRAACLLQGRTGHCFLGALSLWNSLCFSWLLLRFNTGKPSPYGKISLTQKIFWLQASVWSTDAAFSHALLMEQHAGRS